MKVYVAADLDQQKEARTLADALTERGHEIVSSWIYIPGLRELEISGIPEEKANIAVTEIAEVCCADCLVVFTKEAPLYSLGGRHVEMGIAMGNGIDVIVIGPRENVFHYHPSIRRYWSAEDALESEWTIKGVSQNE